MDNRLLESIAKVCLNGEPIQCRERLGGMLNFYNQEAALKMLVPLFCTKRAPLFPSETIVCGEG